MPQEVLDRIDYEAHGKIKFNTDYALFRDGPGVFPVTFFHLGKFFRTPVHMYVLAASGGQPAASEIQYDPGYFSMPADSPGRQLQKGAGFAGFRFQESRTGDQQKLDWHTNDWVAFLGASYFRGIGELYQYGLSARGVAINVSTADHPEEFPDFTRFYFEPPADGSHDVTLYAALEGPSITGAYKFVMHRDKAVVMDIEARLFLRSDVSQLGIAPDDLHVLVLRDGQAHRHRLAAGSPRFRRTRALDRHRRAHLAPAQRHRPSLHIRVRRQVAERLRPATTRPRIRSLPRWCPLRAAPEPLGRATG